MPEEPSLKFNSYNDFSTELKTVLGGKAYTDLLSLGESFLKNIDGKLHCSDKSGTISANYRGKEVFTIQSITENKIVANAKIKFATDDTMFETDPTKQEFVYATSEYIFEKINGKWVVTSFPRPWRAND